LSETRAGRYGAECEGYEVRPWPGIGRKEGEKLNRLNKEGVKWGGLIEGLKIKKQKSA
jgi:hypothetical protein